MSDGKCLAGESVRVPHGPKAGFGHGWRKLAGTSQEFVPAPLRATLVRGLSMTLGRLCRHSLSLALYAESASLASPPYPLHDARHPRRGALALTRRTSAALVRAARHAAFFDRRRRERSERGERSEGAVRLRLPRIVTSDERKHVRGASRKARYARASGGLTVFFRPRSITYWDTALCKQGWTGIDRPSGQAPRLGSGGEQTLPGC